MNKLLGIAVLIILIGGGFWYMQSNKQSNKFVNTADMWGKYPYECDEHVTFTMTPASDMSSIQVAPSNNGTYPPASTLMKKESASGVRYEGNGIVFAGRGETVTLGEGDSAINCSPIPQEWGSFNFGD
ncbi:MAG: hypothetical protein Q7S50_00495 [bacterium]|nr:hypothetical protein [bacterium]